MQKLIKIDLTPSEYLPIGDLIQSYPYPDMSSQTKIQVVTYLAAIALMKGSCLAQDIGHPKELLYFKVEFDFRKGKAKYNYTAILGVDIPEPDKQWHAASIKEGEE